MGIKVSPRSVPLASDGANNRPLLDWLKTAPYPRRKPLPEKRWLEKNTGVDDRDPLSVVGRDPYRTVLRQKPVESGLLGFYLPTHSSENQEIAADQLDMAGYFEDAYNVRDRKLDRRFPQGDFMVLDRENIEGTKKRAEGMASMMGGRQGTGGYIGPSLADHEQRHRAYNVVGEPLSSMLTDFGYTTDPRYKTMPNEVSTRLFDFINDPDEEEPARKYLKAQKGLNIDKMLNDRRILDALAEQERRAKVYLQSFRSFNRELPKGRAQVLSERANTAYDKRQNSGLFGLIRSAFK